MRRIKRRARIDHFLVLQLIEARVCPPRNFLLPGLIRSRGLRMADYLTSEHAWKYKTALPQPISSLHLRLMTINWLWFSLRHRKITRKLAFAFYMENSIYQKFFFGCWKCLKISNEAIIFTLQIAFFSTNSSLFRFIRVLFTTQQKYLDCLCSLTLRLSSWIARGILNHATISLDDIMRMNKLPGPGNVMFSRNPSSPFAVLSAPLKVIYTILSFMHL